jgi:hypothetical protein
VGFFCNKAVSGSVLLVTVDAQTESEPAKLEQKFSEFREAVNDDDERNRIPFGTTAKNLSGWGTAALSHRIIKNEIDRVVSERNALSPEPMIFKQLFNFRYSDTARMLTVGGIIYTKSEYDKLRACNFVQALKFVRTGSDAYTIDLPRLTFRELRHLDSQLPVVPSKLRSKGIKADELRKYAKVYRWFPSFAEVEM